MARNNMMGFIGLCELKIMDFQKYQTVVQLEREKTGKSSV